MSGHCAISIGSSDMSTVTFNTAALVRIVGQAYVAVPIADMDHSCALSHIRNVATCMTAAFPYLLLISRPGELFPGNAAELNATC
jgi:hypothetical protein